MWPKNYKDKPEDAPIKSNQVETGKGIIGCEMHEYNGWGITYHIPKETKGGFLKNLLLPNRKADNGK